MSVELRDGICITNRKENKKVREEWKCRKRFDDVSGTGCGRDVTSGKKREQLASTSYWEWFSHIFPQILCAVTEKHASMLQFGSRIRRPLGLIDGVWDFPVQNATSRHPFVRTNVEMLKDVKELVVIIIIKTDGDDDIARWNDVDVVESGEE